MMNLNQRQTVLALLLVAGLAGCASTQTARACPPGEEGTSPALGQQIEREMTLRMPPGARVNQRLIVKTDGHDGQALAAMVPAEHLFVASGRQPQVARAQVVAVGGDGPQRVLRVKEDGRDIRVEQRGGKVTATINGKPVPANAVTVKNGKIEVRDASGQPVLKEEWPEIEVSTRVIRGVPVVPGVPLPPVAPGITWSGGDDQTPRVMMGITMDDADAGLIEQLGLPKGDYAVIQTVPEGLPAAKAGLQPKDIIVSIDGKSGAGTDGIRDAIALKQPGDTLSVEVIRKGERVKADVKLEAFDGKRFKAYGETMLGQGQSEDVWRLYGDRMKEYGKEIEERAKEFGGDLKSQLDIERLQNHLKLAIPRGNNGEPMILMSPGEGGAKLEERLSAMESQMKRLEELLKRLESRTASPAPAGGGSGNPAPWFANSL
ncbi:MAG: PDZ domain-containing protein [Phycisphaerales bacterium]|nr:PDZ domain-containing protein [Phycisphaerales bacterium]